MMDSGAYHQDRRRGVPRFPIRFCAESFAGSKLVPQIRAVPVPLAVFRLLAGRQKVGCRIHQRGWRCAFQQDADRAFPATKQGRATISQGPAILRYQAEAWEARREQLSATTDLLRQIVAYWTTQLRLTPTSLNGLSRPHSRHAKGWRVYGPAHGSV